MISYDQNKIFGYDKNKLFGSREELMKPSAFSLALLNDREKKKLVKPKLTDYGRELFIGRLTGN